MKRGESLANLIKDDTVHIQRLVYSALALIFLNSAQAFEQPHRWIVSFKSMEQSESTKGFGLPRENGKGEKRVVTSVLEITKLMSDSEVASIEKDRLMTTTSDPFSLPNDPLYNSQWHYTDSLSGISLPEAWNLTQGQNSVTVAIVDTGILPHPDIASKTLPGVDMISDARMGNDGDGRDLNATDSGDSINQGDFCFTGNSSNSSWHGTHVAGTVGALTNNGVGVAGVNPGSKILPIRVLGKCGGYTSDIVDGLKWAAGLPVSGLPINPNPAKVLNLSLGSQGNCSRSMQQAINEVRARGAVIVVAAGNSGTNIDYMSFSPANCQGVVTIGASNIQGARSYYSNYGKRLDVMAPGGDSQQGILSTSDSGTSNAFASTYKSMSGTSMAAPHVAGIISLMFSVNSKLVPSQVIEILKETASSMPISYGCENGSCGAGLVNAFEAIDLARVTSTTGVVDNYKPTLPRDESQQVYTTSSSNGGGCGSIDLTNSDGGSGGGFFGSLVLGMMIVLLGKMRDLRKKLSPIRK